MPCRVKHRGEAKVSEYFEAIIQQNEKKPLLSSFRGYPLCGETIKLPQGFVGVVVDGKDNEFKVKSNFAEFTYWNWDKNPSDSDTVPQAFKWISIAAAIHKPIKPCDLN
ncbi:ribonuclease H2 subunit C-like protein [Dinothrombium tinctorium]|uniref:Ribonuclease H2 subunit C-like protein n=1 Tax=Dinothrombium tinctorium TaxID=1965070 RepID=A0A3S3QR64_9ACAR|nr:ribonuclease H2 subunit C-like protein [Dinothrombium tinctorium]RWS12731.1 ribonuclease H2 subunit C-like protein [Dinothrombium tinctorium]RWS13308.1 ribonuclease H2 subunit C-like protein [Dinothrombium tinctorium]